MLRSLGICLEIVKLTVANMTMFSEESTMRRKTECLKCLVKIFTRYGGLLGKIAQVLSMTTEESEVFDNCDPIMNERTTEYVRDEISQWDIYDGVLEIESAPCNTGSIGQVYRAKLNGKDVVFKVRLYELKETIAEDFKIVDFLLNNIYMFSHTENAIDDIKDQVINEMNFHTEVNNQNRIRDLYANDPTIVIPEIYKDLCTEETIVMEYMEGFESMNAFINNSTVEERNRIGDKLITFVFENLYKHGIFYSDVHYGNFLVKDKNILCVLDFGCLHQYTETETENLKEIHRTVLYDDKKKLVDVMKKMDVFSNSTMSTTIDRFYDKLKVYLSPFIRDDFVFTNEWVDSEFFMDRDIIADMGLPRGVILLQKIPLNLYHLLSKLGTTNESIKYINETYIKTKN